jgi:signal transduction histidine kinase
MTAGEDTDSWWVSVRDDGPGLPAKARENLFTAFQGGARKGGVGLGLAISADLVRGHGGQLQLVKSSPEGTVFLLRLPKNDVLTEPSLYPSDLVTM